MLAEICKILEFDAAHRVLGHESHCKYLHGHRYRAEITVSAKSLDDIGRVIDFSEVKRIVGGWIEDNWDHNIILHPHDPLVYLFSFELAGSHPVWGTNMSVFAGKRPFVMGTNYANPTVENMVIVLYDVASGMLSLEGVSVVRVRLWETPTCYAEYPPRS